MPRDEIEQDPHPPPVRFRKERVHLFVRPVARGDSVVIAHVVTRVLKRRGEAWIDPDRVDAERLKIIQLTENARQIPDSIAVRIMKALRIELIEDRGIQPARRHGMREIGKIIIARAESRAMAIALFGFPTYLRFN